MKKILFASNNVHKVEEIKMLLPDGYTLLGLRDINWNKDIPEPFDTYEENASAKADYIFEHTGLNSFADDSGLEIDALDGRPGVYSARYGGEERNSVINIQRVLTELSNISNRTARFRSVIAYLDENNKMLLFQGVVEGRITITTIGSRGFGYDPIFIPNGFDQTFGELSENIKNRISHRAKAMQKFITFLKNTST
ncbi:MAG: RdgB/HAM1 family non-canonical purine NTP pyrophosphatase [Saprospiraceae bacterium]